LTDSQAVPEAPAAAQATPPLGLNNFTAEQQAQIQALLQSQAQTQALLQSIMVR
jgi:hypothetical protein